MSWGAATPVMEPSLQVTFRATPSKILLRSVNVAGAITVSLKGDIEPLPDWQAIETFLNVHGAGEKRLPR